MRILYYCHVEPTGYGRAALDLCTALVRAGVDVQIVPIAGILDAPIRVSSTYLPLAPRMRAANPAHEEVDAVVIHTLPFSCAEALERIRKHGVTAKKWIAYTTWEAWDVPQALFASLGVFDQVWIPSGHGLQSRLTPSEGVVVPHGFDADLLGSRRERPAQETPDPRYRFCYAGAWNSRKNPTGVMRAFAHAFHGMPDADVVLELQCTGANPDAIRVAAASTGLPASWWNSRISITTRVVTDWQFAELYQRSHCYVSASRGEAWNYGAFDAMLAGRHVITTEALGSDEYLLDTSAVRCPAWLTPAYLDVEVAPRSGDLRLVGPQRLTSGLLWREPDLTMLAESMRHAFERRVDRIEVPAGHLDRFTFASIAKTAITHLEE